MNNLVSVGQLSEGQYVHDMITMKVEVAYFNCQCSMPPLVAVQECLIEDLETEIRITRGSANKNMALVSNRILNKIKNDIGIVQNILDSTRLPYRIGMRCFNVAQQSVFDYL